jgi:hypothetical protein
VVQQADIGRRDGHQDPLEGSNLVVRVGDPLHHPQNVHHHWPFVADGGP